MKLIGGKDYYDGLASHSAVNGVYERHIKELPISWFGFTEDREGVTDGLITREYELSTGILGFCGKIYPYIKCVKSTPETGKTIDYIHTLEEYNTLRSELTLGNYKSNRYWNTTIFDNFTLKDFTKDPAKDFFEGNFKPFIEHTLSRTHSGRNGRVFDFSNLKDLFIEHKVPYYIIKYTRNPNSATGHSLILNPCLSDYKVYRMFDAYTAYQEIDMFLNNEIVRPDDPYIEPIPDKIKAESHGFDKFSFRRSKGKKKRGKKKLT